MVSPKVPKGIGKKSVFIGHLGEDAALKYIQKKGYTIVDRNYRASHYEIDFIAENQHYLVFVEVKARSCTDPEHMAFGRPSEAVTYGKQKRTVAAAGEYLRTHPAKGKQIRLDVIEVYFNVPPPGTPPSVLKIHHIENAFGA